MGERDWADVRFGSKADIGGSVRNVRFTPESGHRIEGVSAKLRPLAGLFFAVDCIGVIRHLPVTLYISPVGRSRRSCGKDRVS